MENRDELMSEILRRVQRNYMHMVEIERLTKELGDSLSRNDQESAQLLIKMRQEEMDKVSEAKEEILLITQSVPAEDKQKIEMWLKGKAEEEPTGFEAGKIVELSSQTMQVLNRTIAIDKMINMKLAGKESYYHAAT